MAAIAGSRSAARCARRRGGRSTGCRSPACTRRVGPRIPAARSPEGRGATPRSWGWGTWERVSRRCFGVPDARVQAAIDHWAPRFVQAGVDYNDFVRTTARIERWEDWLDGWCAVGDEHASLAREAEAARREQTAGEAWLRAAVAYHFGKFVW